MKYPLSSIAMRFLKWQKWPRRVTIEQRILEIVESCFHVLVCIAGFTSISKARSFKSFIFYQREATSTRSRG